MALGSTNAPGIAGKDAADAKKLAQTANTNAEAAKFAAENAKKAANAAVTAAESAKTVAESAQTAAASAQTAAAAAQSAANKAAEDMEKINQAIEDGGGSLGGSGNTIEITFEAAFSGQTFTVADSKETKTGTVPESLVASVKVKNCNSTYTIRAQANNGVEYSTSVTTGAYYGQYTASLSVFNATINVTAVAGATVKATKGSEVFTATAGDNGIAAVRVNQAGTYTVSATKDNAASNSTSVNVAAESTYTATVSFIRLTVTSEPGATLKLVNGSMTLTGGGTGTDVFYLPNTGTWTATLTSPEETTTKSINVTAYQDYTLKVMFVSEVLNENDWEKIRDVSDAGEGANYWSVGDTKTITINGKVGNFTFSNLSVQAFILGFNHNSAKEGNNRIHFQIGKITGKMVGLCDSKYGNSISSTGYFSMNSSNTNSGGWNNSYMRKTLLGNSNSPTSPLANSLMAALPSDLRNNMKSVTKYTDNTGGGSDTASYVTSTTDYLFLLSEFEVQGKRTYANSAEQNSQKQYEYYRAGNGKVAYQHTNQSTAVWWWLRSPYYGTSYSFCITGADASPPSDFANVSGGVLPGFAV